MAAAQPAPVITDVDFLEQMIEDAELRAFGGVDAMGERVEPERGIAGIQAVKHLMVVKAQLDAARKALAESKGDGSEEAFLAEFDERLRGLPTPYLERAVTEYLNRHPGVRLLGMEPPAKATA